jgi:hypothetical protein
LLPDPFTKGAGLFVLGEPAKLVVELRLGFGEPASRCPHQSQDTP